MAVIADDCPAQEKASPADITLVANEAPAQEEGFFIDKSKKIFQPCNTAQDSDKEPLPVPGISTEPPSPPPDKKRGKKRRKRKQKKKKINKVVIKVIKGKRSKPGHFSRKFLFKLPRKAIKNGIFLVALCSFLQYHMAQSANCMKSVPVSDFPINLKQNEQNFTFQKRTFCPDKVDIFGSCAACHKNESLLEIFCTNAVALDIWVEDEKGNDEILVRMTSEDCNFVKKSHERRMKRRSLGSDRRGRETSVEEKHEHGKTNRNDDEDTLTCTESVPVSDFPILLHQDDQMFNFQEPVICPRRVDIFGSCFACFKELSLLKITCSIVDDVEIRAESGKGVGNSTVVTMSPEACNRSVEEEPTEKPEEEHHNGHQIESQTGVKEKIKNFADVTPAGTNNGTSYWKAIGPVILVMHLVGCGIYVIKSERERRRLFG